MAGAEKEQGKVSRDEAEITCGWLCRSLLSLWAFILSEKVKWGREGSGGV
jgi:hypothetical protein